MLDYWLTSTTCFDWSILNIISDNVGKIENVGEMCIKYEFKFGFNEFNDSINIKAMSDHWLMNATCWLTDIECIEFNETTLKFEFKKEITN